MPAYTDVVRRRFFLLAVPCILALLLVLSACGTNTTTGTGTVGNTPTTTGVTATATSHATANGCPSNAVVSMPTTAPNVVLTNANSGKTITVQQGNHIQVNLPFGHAWQGPINLSSGILSMQGPEGFDNNSAKSCTWLFLAASTGTAHLSFAGRPICKKNQACPMYIMAVPFTIIVK